MNKMLISIICLFALIFSSCGDDDNNTTDYSGYSISISPESLSIPFEGATQSIEVTANVEWAVYSDASWCIIDRQGSLAGITTINLNIAKNTATSPRTANITFKSGQYKKIFEVNQKCDEAKPEIETPEGYTLVWNQEFDEAMPNGKAMLPDENQWWYETGASGWGNNEIQNYIPAISGTDSCAFISNGTLKIVAKKSGSQVYSVRMNTSKSWTYGYFEARLKLSKGKGAWPAFWMMPKNYTAWPDDGEIDIMEEVGYRPNYISSTVHCKAYNHSNGTQKTGETYISGAESEFHIYAVEWTADYIKGFADGICYFTFTNDKSGNKDSWPFDAPFYLKLNLAWGGNWGGAQGIDESALPCTYEIDYVRVFQK